MYQVTILVCTYYPEMDKLYATLNSILVQRNIAFQIVISDDGTDQFQKEQIMNWFEERNFFAYKILSNKKNLGTVYNCLKGLEVSEGDYIFDLSPGDLLYDSDVICKMYKFVMDNKIDFCFGQAQYFSVNNGNVNLLPIKQPSLPNIFDVAKYNRTVVKIGFFCGQNICGVTYFRKRELYKKYLLEFAGKVRYVEDKSTTALYLISNNPLYFCGFKSTWYEYGTGISTKKDIISEKKVHRDYEQIGKVLLEKYPNDPVLDAKYRCHGIIRVIKHPIISLVGIYIKWKSWRKKKHKDYDESINANYIFNLGYPLHTRS